MNTQRLLHVYIALLLPALIGFTLAHWALQHYHLSLLDRQDQAVVAIPLFILSAISAWAAPILYRTLFAYRNRHRYSVSWEELYRFERNLLAITMATPYLALSAYMLHVPQFHLCGILLMAMYAVYYYFPSYSRIMADWKIFRGATEAIPDTDNT